MVDGKQYDMEIHFVFKKVNNTNPNAGDAISVIGIVGEVSKSVEATGVWKQVAPIKVQQCDSVEKSMVSLIPTFSHLLMTTSTTKAH